MAEQGDISGRKRGYAGTWPPRAAAPIGGLAPSRPAFWRWRASRAAIQRGLAPVTVGLILASGYVLVRATDATWVAYALTGVTALVVGVDGVPVFDDAGPTSVIPASNMKLVTAAVALEVLGPDHRFTTEAKADQAPAPAEKPASTDKPAAKTETKTDSSGP